MTLTISLSLPQVASSTSVVGEAATSSPGPMRQTSVEQEGAGQGAGQAAQTGRQVKA